MTRSKDRAAVKERGTSMSETGAGLPGRQGITIDQLIALNDEIAALSRSGMPLERGLLDIGSDLPGRLRTLSTTLGERMSRGESLSEALESSGAGVPRVYRAVVEAGVRSGRLSVALEGLATYARGFSEARRNIGLALWYPLLVLCAAYSFMIGFMLFLVPRFVGAFESLGLPIHGVLKGLAFLGTNVWYWAWIFPLLLILGTFSWFGSSRAVGFGSSRARGLLRWFPWLGRMLTGYEASSFADLMAILIEHKLPYPEALRLAGEASCDPSLAESSRKLADAISKGQSPSEALQGKSAFPPLLRWVLAGSTKQGDFVQSLRVMSARYRGQAQRESEKIRLFLPMILLLGLGTSVTFLYCLALFLPLASLWKSLALDWP